MRRHEFLRQLHRLVQPRNYLEIGVADGGSLTLSRVPSIGIDPAFRVTTPLHCDLELVRSTSDDFFARADPLHHLRSARNPIRNARRGRPLFGHYTGGTSIDLSFIDGMHWSDFVLRDFMNVERHSAWSSVIVFDDMLPRDVDEAARDRHTEQWAGDVYKLISVLTEHRPDLAVIPVDTTPTGVLVVLGADPTSHVLADRYDVVAAGIVLPDPQDVPTWVLKRQTAADPEVLVASPLWADLVRARRRRRGREAGMQLIDGHLAAMGLTRSGRAVVRAS